MKEYQASITIRASADKVWQILTQAEEYPRFDPLCDEIRGTIVLGNKIKAFSKLSPGRAFPVKVTQMDENRQMTWSGGMPLGLFKGVRTFTLQSVSESETSFTVREVFSGPMLALIGRSIPDMTDPFQQFVDGLKAHAEVN